MNNSIRIESNDPDVQLLKSENILTRTEVRISGSGLAADGFVAAQIAAFRKRNESEPGAWSLAQTSDQLFITGGENVQTRIAELELTRLFPTPAEDVALEDVLDFRARRSDELLRLRAALDRLYQDILQAADSERAALTARNEIEGAIRELDQVLNESGIRRFLSSFKVDLDLKNAAEGLLKGGAAGVVFGLPIELATPAGGVFSGLSLKIKRGSRLADLSASAQDYAYLGYAKKELESRSAGDGS